jgi:hypothetical protein
MPLRFPQRENMSLQHCAQLAAIRKHDYHSTSEKPVPTNWRKSRLASNNFKHLAGGTLSEMSNIG